MYCMCLWLVLLSFGLHSLFLFLNAVCYTHDCTCMCVVDCGCEYDDDVKVYVATLGWGVLCVYVCVVV